MPAPAPASPGNIASGLGGYLKKNAKFAYGGLIGAAFLASDVKGILDADNKFKALLKTFKDFLVIRIAMVGIFTGVAAAVKSLVRETGSLDEALKKFTQIQQYSRQFQAFTGSLGSARQRISELYQLSLRKPFKFEDIVEANKALEVFTRGTYTSVTATKTIGEAAIASGNSISDTARAVGQFYDQLRSGEPIENAAEQLRQMGLISQDTADNLTGMATSGTDVTATFNQLTSALQDTAAGAAGYKDELEGITAEHQKAVAELQKAFGAPFAESESENIKNRTAAYQAITPVVAKLSQQAAGLYNGFSTAGTAVTKFLAQSSLVQRVLAGAGKGFMIATVAAGIFASFAAATLIPALVQLSTGISAFAGAGLLRLGVNAGIAATAVTTLETTLVGLSYALPIAAVAGFGVAIVGAMVHAREEVKKIKREFADWSASQDKATASLLAQVAAISTLTDKNEALAAAMDRIIELQKIRNQLADKEKHSAREQQKGWQFRTPAYMATHPGADPRSPLGRWWDKAAVQQEKVNKQEEKRAKIHQDIAKKALDDAAKSQTVNKQLVDSEAQRAFEIEQQTKGAKQRDFEARAGLKAQADLEGQLGENEKKRVSVQKQLDEERERFGVREKRTPEQIARHQAKQAQQEEELTKIAKERQDIQLQAPEFSATYKEAKAAQLRQAKIAKELEAAPPGARATAEVRNKYEQDLRRSRALAGPQALAQYSPAALHAAEVAAAKQKKVEAAPPSPEEKRQADVQKFQIDTEIKGHQARRRGDIATAQQQEDIADFTSNFEQLLPLLGKQQAAAVALDKTSDNIATQYQDSQKVVSSMTAIGGGGGVSGVNPQLESAKRREALQQEMVKLLEVLTGQENGAQGQASTFGP